MIIITTPGELFDRGLWMDACELVGLDEWAVNEGQMDTDEPIRLTEQQATTLGLIAPTGGATT